MNKPIATSSATSVSKSYVSSEDRERLIKNGYEDCLYLAEAISALESGDTDAMWQWISKGRLPPVVLRMLKIWRGAQFIKDKGLDTSLADAVYGADWLEPQPSSNMPKSYLSQEEREKLLRDGDMDQLYVAEGVAACGARDLDTAWTWLAKAKLPPTALRMIKAGRGVQFILEKGFNTSLADAEYGPNWLESK